MDITVAPWQPDGDAQYCPICQHQFSLFYRRHHCRICGKVVCGSCSQSFIPYPPDSYVLPPYQSHPEPAGTLFRTCDDCIREPASIESTSYSSFPSATISSRQTQPFPSIILSPNRTSHSPPSPAASLFSKGSVINPTFPSVDLGSPSSSSSTDPIRRARSGSNLSRRIQHRNRLSQSSLASTHAANEPSQSFSTSSDTSITAPAEQSSSEAKSGRLYSALRFIGSYTKTSQSKTSVVEDAVPSTQHSRNSSTARHVGLRILGSNETASRENDEIEDEENTCPICGFKLETIATEEEREAHVNKCLQTGAFSGSPDQPRRNRMVIYKLPQSDAGKECVICFEEFEKDDVVARLECLCVYHRQCIKAWFDKKGVGECPIHSAHH
ncbi:FYVE zinc finger-domain-containing protein [Lipomyces japonicus]|uniref:FYVE zinc finger-domain-containing protein n=1 Tax=Lipomyces japonicus TaxID=56871 RepID=UPI0034CE79A1